MTMMKPMTRATTFKPASSARQSIRAPSRAFRAQRVSALPARAQAPAPSKAATGKQDVQSAPVTAEADTSYTPFLGLGSLMTPFILECLAAPPAQAAGGEFGILEGRIVSLTHPAVMFVLFLSTFYTGYLGWQWRRARTLPAEIKELKAQLPKPDAEGNVASSPLDAQIKDLEATRKQLLEGKFKDRHFSWGSLLLGSGVTFSVAGAINTWMRTGKLFPGPHLWAGAGITVLWALASAQVPAMQKGDEGARNWHIGLNCINLGLFVWQIPTGLEIVWKVLEFTKFP